MSKPSVAGFFPWRRVKVTYVNSVEASHTAIAVVEPDRRFRPICHVCGAPGAIHTQTRKFDLDLGCGDFTMLLQVEHRKIRCHRCYKVRVEGLEFVNASARVTHRLAAYAAQLCKAGLSVEAVARHLDLDPKTVKAIDKDIDDIRNEEFRKASGDLRDQLTGSKYLFLTNWGNLKRDGRVQLEDILTLNERLNTVYRLKDLLYHIWDYYYPGWAMKMQAEWCEVARQDGHPALAKFAEQLARHQYGIVSHCKHQIHTSNLEGVNNKIKVVKRIAYVFHDLEYLALKVKQALPGRFVGN